MDKYAYFLGTNVIVFFAYLLAYSPHKHIYTYSTFIMALFLLHRYYTFWYKSWHFYLIDFCYFGNFLTFYYINFATTNKDLMVTAYLLGNGTLATGILAFRNSLVYHKMDFLCSLLVHGVPLIITLHIRWYTIPDQQGLPED